MIIKERKFKGVFEIQLEPHEDERGFFMRVYDNKIFKMYGLHKKWVQESHSLSIRKGTIRGMHFRFSSNAETKLIRIVRGEICDVFVDLRKDSLSFGQWDSINLSADNKKMIYIPKGFAHGFCTLAKNTEILYKMDNYYEPDNAGIIKWNDQDLEINWPVNNPALSKKDSKAKSFREFVKKHGGLKVET